MKTFIDPVLMAVDSLLEWMSGALKQHAGSYVELETAETRNTLVARDGSLVSVIKIDGIRHLVGADEFEQIHGGLTRTLSTAMSHPGHCIQAMFTYDNDGVSRELDSMLQPARDTAQRLDLSLDDLFAERVNFLAKYCAKELNFLVLWTRPGALSKQQQDMANKRKRRALKKHKVPPMRYAQGVAAGFDELREIHESFVRATASDLGLLGMDIELLDVYSALYYARMSVDAAFTSDKWRPRLPGDRIPMREVQHYQTNDVSDILWPPLYRQLVPRDGENLGLRECRIGDRLYAPLFIDLFPKDVQGFHGLFQRCHSAGIPWRVSYLFEGNGLETIKVKAAIAGVLSFASAENKLIDKSKKMLDYIATNTDDSVVKLRMMFSTWAPIEQRELLRVRRAELAKAIQGWGHCEVAEISGDAYGATLCSALALNSKSLATPSVAPLSDVVFMMPIIRPSSTWAEGAIVFRSPDGKPWPYQPGSSKQTTWIDLIYARPGSGKSVLSNAINLALCLNAGLTRLPRIAIIDIGPSSSGLISLLKEALPKDKKHLVTYQRLRMTPQYAINPFDTQLGARFPTPLERAFLVNFITLLATPLGSERPYDGITDMAGMVIDELYEERKDENNPNRYSAELDPELDKTLHALKFRFDSQSSWWEVTDFLFEHEHKHLALRAQRFAVPLIAEAASMCRTAAIDDLFGKIVAPTGESLIQAFGRMISSAVREYPILARPTAFDLGEARVVSLDLDEVAKTGGEAADRQTAVMYMLARYILARDYYLTIENVNDIPIAYREHHRVRIMEIREDPKRIVMDEFHRTAKAKAVRDQVIVDMREGRKWKVQVALLSQSLDDFDSVMVDFGTSIFIMDAGPAQSIEKTAKIFGLSPTAKRALRLRVHGPRAGGGTFLAQFATKSGVNTQLLTNTIGPVELWAFSTTPEDARVRNELYERIGPRNARRVLAHLYPSGSISSVFEQRLSTLKDSGMYEDDSEKSVLHTLIQEIIQEYKTNPTFRESH